MDREQVSYEDLGNDIHKVQEEVIDLYQILFCRKSYLPTEHTVNQMK